MCRSIEMVHRGFAVICVALLLGCERHDDAKPAASQSTGAAPQSTGAAPQSTGATPQSTAAASQSSRELRFEDFPADTFVGRPAPVDLTSDPDARSFRTVLREGAAEGPNFAGHLTIITWGCGTQCMSHALVDARSGRVYSDTTLDFSCHDPEFRRNSTLVIQRANTETFGECSATVTRFFRWTGNRFVDIATAAAP